MDLKNVTTTLQCLHKIHFITIVNLQHSMLIFMSFQLYKVTSKVVDLLMYLVHAIAISTKNMMVCVGHVSLTIKFGKLVPIYLKRLSLVSLASFSHAALGIMPCFLWGKMPCCVLGKHAMLPLGIMPCCLVNLAPTTT